MTITMKYIRLSSMQLRINIKIYIPKRQSWINERNIASWNAQGNEGNRSLEIIFTSMGLCADFPMFISMAKVDNMHNSDHT